MNFGTGNLKKAYLLGVKATRLRALSEVVTLGVPEHFTAAIICSNQQLLPAVIVKILKQKCHHCKKKTSVHLIIC